MSRGRQTLEDRASNHKANRTKPQPRVFIYSIRSARSFSFFMPAKTILVPGIYFLGLTRYSYMCLSDHMMPEFLFASEYAKPSSVPDWRPKTPHSGGPCLALPPFSIVWHWAHFPLKSFAPFFTSPSGTSTFGSSIGIAETVLLIGSNAGLEASRDDLNQYGLSPH